MLNNLSATNRNGKEIKAVTEETLKKLISNLESHVNDLQEVITDLSTSVNTETVNTSDVHTNDIDTHTLSATSGSIDYLNSLRIIVGELQATTASLHSLTVDEVNAERLYGALQDFQEKLNTAIVDSYFINSKDGKFDNVETNSLKTSLLELKTIIAETIGTNTLNAKYGTINDLTADQVNTYDFGTEYLNSHESHIHRAYITELDADISEIAVEHAHNSKVDRLDNADQFGVKQINLNPRLSTDDDYYLLTVKKGFTTLELFVEDSFDITLTEAYLKNADVAKLGSTLVLFHQKELGQIVAISDDNENIYIQIAPNNTNELEYKINSKKFIKDPITVEVNGTFEPDYFYRPVRCAECVMLGKTDNGSSDYRMSVLGEFKAAVKINEGTEELQDVAILNSLYVKDYFDETSGKWIYTHGNKDEYISRFNDEREMAWRPGATASEDGTIVLTEDSTEEVYDADGNFLGIRQVPGTEGALASSKLFSNWNGKVQTTELDEDGNPIVKNPLTKLGKVDEGEWDAGAITSNESLNIKHGEITWNEDDYSLPEADEDLSWVRF